MAKNSDAMNELQKQLLEKFMEIIKNVMQNRSDYFASNPDEVPGKDDVKSIINKYSNRSMIVSGVAGLAPGPVGMLAVIPEVFAIIDNQIKIIYDVAVAYGKQRILTKELILSVFASAVVTGGIGAITIQGSKVLVQRASKSLIQKILQIVAVKTSQGAFRSMVSKYIPIAGAAAIAAWSNYSTRQVGKKAVEIFGKDIEYISESPNIGVEEFSQEEIIEDTQSSNVINESSDESFAPLDSTSSSLDELRIQSLINLMLVDGKAHPEEQEYIREIIDNVNLDYKRKMFLLESLDTSDKFKIDYKEIANSPDDALGLLVDLVALSNHDGKFHISEKMYVKQVGKQLGFSEHDIEEMMSAE
jgi:uncharacterized tellurite resistance protein B-like protein/uncharacterized protein (DUF697 family)